MGKIDWMRSDSIRKYQTNKYVPKSSYKIYAWLTINTPATQYTQRIQCARLVVSVYAILSTSSGRMTQRHWERRKVKRKRKKKETRWRNPYTFIYQPNMLSTWYQYIFIHVSCMTEHLYYGRGPFVVHKNGYAANVCFAFSLALSLSFCSHVNYLWQSLSASACYSLHFDWYEGGKEPE